MAQYGNYRPNESGSIELDSQQYEIDSLQSKGEDEELYCVIDCDLVESNISKAGTSPVQQGISKTDSNKLGENVFASSSHPTEEQDNTISRTNNHTLKDSNKRKSNTKATIMLLVGIVAGGVASSAITVIIKDMKSSKQDSCPETKKHTDVSSVAFVAKIVNDTSPSAGSTLIFTTPVVNQGDGYNPSTGIFKAPVGGVYMFFVQLCIGDNAFINFEIRSSTTVYSITEHGEKVLEDTCSSVTTVAVLKPGEEVWVKCLARNTSSIEAHESPEVFWNMFSGALIQVPDMSVAFVAKIVSDKSPSAGDTLIFTTPVVNQGNGYNQSTGIFKAPVGGVYMFSVQLCIGDNAFINYEIRSSTTVYSITEHGEKVLNDTCTSVTTVAVLKPGEEVLVKCLARSTSSIEAHESPEVFWNMFSGALIQVSNTSVAFVATIVSDKSPSAGDTLIFTTPVVNQGDGYTPATGIFKAPVGGVYMFSVQICLNDNTFINYEIRSSTTVYSITEHGENVLDDECSSVTTVAVLTRGEDIWVKCLGRDSGTGYDGYTIEPESHSIGMYWNMFTGALIQEM